MVKHMLKCALSGAAFAGSAVVAGAISWTIAQAHFDRKHMVSHGQRRRLEDAQATHPQLPRQRPAPAIESIPEASGEDLHVTRDAFGRAMIATKRNGLFYELHHSRDYDRDGWTELVERVTGSGIDTAAREGLRMSPAERRR